MPEALIMRLSTPVAGHQVLQALVIDADGGADAGLETPQALTARMRIAGALSPGCLLSPGRGLTMVPYVLFWGIGGAPGAGGLEAGAGRLAPGQGAVGAGGGGALAGLPAGRASAASPGLQWGGAGGGSSGAGALEWLLLRPPSSRPQWPGPDSAGW